MDRFLHLLALAITKSDPYYMAWRTTGNLWMKTASLVIYDRVLTEKDVDISVKGN